MFILLKFQPFSGFDNSTNHLLFADSIDAICVAGVGRKENKRNETKVRVGGCSSSGMIVQALIHVLGKGVMFYFLIFFVLGIILKYICSVL